jgi:hypothetical protein
MIGAVTYCSEDLPRLYNPYLLPPRLLTSVMYSPGFPSLTNMEVSGRVVRLIPVDMHYLHARPKAIKECHGHEPFYIKICTLAVVVESNTQISLIVRAKSQ